MKRLDNMLSTGGINVHEVSLNDLQWLRSFGPDEQRTSCSSDLNLQP